MASSTPLADRLRTELERRLLELGGKLPTSSLARLGRTALAGLRGGRIALGRRGAGGAPDVESLVALVAALGQLKGVAMKAGQLLGYLDLPLGPELQAALSVLQTHSPALPFEEVRALIERELGQQAGPLVAELERTPVAAASIGQVHRGRLPDGTRVAVKVQYPEIERAIAADFRSAALGRTLASLIAPGARVDAVIEHARRALLDECDYTREASYQTRWAAIYAGHATIRVPAVHDAYVSRRVLTTSWVEGLRLDDYLATAPARPERDRLGEALFEFYVGTLFRHGLCNWDPHPGNYVVCSDGRLALFDYGSTLEYGRALVRKMAALTLAVQADTEPAFAAALADFGQPPGRKAYDFEAIRPLLRALYGPVLRDAEQAVELGESAPVRALFEGKRQLLGARLPPELLFMFRVRLGLMSVLARLGARANWYRLERGYAEDAQRGTEP